MALGDTAGRTRSNPQVRARRAGLSCPIEVGRADGLDGTVHPRSSGQHCSVSQPLPQHLELALIVPGACNSRPSARERPETHRATNDKGPLIQRCSDGVAPRRHCAMASATPWSPGAVEALVVDLYVTTHSSSRFTSDLRRMGTVRTRKTPPVIITHRRPKHSIGRYSRSPCRPHSGIFGSQRG
jgi:hypothetical protein